MIRDLARRLVEHPDDPARWLELAGQLATSPGDPTRALALLDEAADTIGASTARTLLLELTGVPWGRLGRAFAAYPDVSTVGVHLSADSFHLRPAPAPGGDRWLVATDTGWQIFDTSALSPCETPPPVTSRAAETPVCWLDEHTLVAGHGTALTTVGVDGEAAAAPPVAFEHAIVGLVGPLDGRRVAVATTRYGVRDVFVVAMDGRRPVWLPNISAALTIEAAPLRGTGFLCTGDGVQSSEVREVRLDGGWRTHMLHTAALRGVSTVDGGRRAVSVDRVGRVVVWDGTTGRARPVDSGELGESFGALVRRPVQCGFVVGRRELWVVHADRRGLVFAPLDAESTTFVGGLCWLPMSLPSGARALPVGAEDGWLWVDPTTRSMPEPLRLPARLATDDELAALPGVQRADVGALRAGQSPSVETTLRVRPPIAVLEQLV